MSFGQRIRQLRNERKLTQKQLVAAVRRLGGKLSQSQLAAIENDEVKRTGAAPELAVALDTTTEALLGVAARRGRSSPGKASPLPDTLGRRLRGIRAVFPGMASQIGVTSEVAWQLLFNLSSSLDSRLAQQVAAATGLPISYVLMGDTSELTREQAASLLASALEDGANPSPDDQPGEAPVPRQTDRAEARKRS